MAGNKLEDRLSECGCAVALVDFQDHLVDLLSNIFPSWTVDEMLLHPRSALYFCDSVKRDEAYNSLPDELILRCLLSRRKNP